MDGTVSPGVIAAAAGALVVGSVLLSKALYPKKRDGKIRRTMSFTTRCCAEGPFSDASKMSQPIIHSCMFFNKTPTREALAKTITTLFNYERFRSKKVKVDGEWHFEVLDQCNAEEHIFEETVSGTEEVLWRRIEELSVTPLRVSDDKPPFEFVLIKNTGSGPSLIAARINHAIGDGISLAKLINVVYKDVDGNPLPPAERFTRREKNFLPSIYNPFRILSSLFSVLTVPNSAFDTDIGLLGERREKLVFSGKRSVVRVPVLKLGFIKAIKNAAHTTLNDVIYAATAGAIHRLREAANDPAIVDPDSGKEVHTRALLPVAIPRNDKDPTRALRNKWSFASVSMPIGVKGSIERLMASNKTLGQLKNSPIVIVTNMFENIVGRRLPCSLAKQVAFDTFVRHTLVFSNVPGPECRISFAGQEVTSIFMVYANLIPQFGALSMNGKMYMCVTLDKSAVKDADKLSEYLVEELKDMANRLNVPSTNDDVFA